MGITVNDIYNIDDMIKEDLEVYGGQYLCLITEVTVNAKYVIGGLNCSPQASEYCKGDRTFDWLGGVK